MQSRALFWRPSVWSAAVDGLWSVIVSVAWPLTDRLSRWSPSTGGGNESGLRSLLLSAPANTLFVTPSAYLGHLTSFDMMSVSVTRVYVWACKCGFAKTWAGKWGEEINCCTALLEPHTFNSFPCLIWCSQAAESAKQSGTRIFPALHRCPSSRRDLSGSTEALTERQSHKLQPSALHKSFGETNQITFTTRCLSMFQLHVLWLQGGPHLDFPYIHVIRASCSAWLGRHQLQVSLRLPLYSFKKPFSGGSLR